MNKALKNFLLLCLIMLTFTACDKKMEVSGKVTNLNKEEENKLQILVTNPILKEMVEKIDGKKNKIDVQVNNPDILKLYEPDIDIIVGREYDALFYLGVGYEPFMKEILEKIDRNKVNIINIARGVNVKRFKEDKLENEIFYYLTNSENYQIAMFSIKNALEEMDHGSSQFYNSNYMVESKKLDKLQNEIKDFMDTNKKLYFVCDSYKLQYICDEYKRDYINVSDFRRDMENPATSRSSQAILEDQIIFLYADDISLKKYSDDIVKYKMKPVKLMLYDYEKPMFDIYNKNFDKIKEARDSFDKQVILE